MKKKFHVKRNFNPGILMPGLFLFFFLTAADGAPAIRYSLSESAGFINMSIMAFALEPFKTSTVKIKYTSGIDIENASVATSVTSLSVGASIDTINTILDITIFQTKKTSIDNRVLISLRFPSGKSLAPSDLAVMEAQFTDYSGTTFNVPVSNDVKIRHFYAIPEHSHCAPYGYYLLSGRKVAGTIALKRELPHHRYGMNVRIVQKVDIHE
jgi:hypothetical protein